MKLLAVYVGQESQLNLQHGLDVGIWGFKRNSMPDGLQDLAAGDMILLATGFTGGSPRISLEKWKQYSVSKIWFGIVSAPAFEEARPEWPDEDAMTENERYVWRIKFDPRSVQSISDVRLDDSLLISEKLSDLFRKSGCAHGTGYIAELSEFAGRISKQRPQFWVEKTGFKGRPARESGDHALGKALWSPQRSEDGKDIYRAMREVKPGDVVFHLVDDEAIVGYSIVSGVVDDSFVGLEDTPWAGRQAYRVPLEGYTELRPKIGRREFLQEGLYRPVLAELLMRGKGQFYNRVFNLNQGSYLTAAPLELVEVWDDIFRKKSGKPLNESWDIPPFRLADLSMPNRNYWAGGFGEHPRLQEFMTSKIWKLGWSASDQSSAARRCWTAFSAIKIGDGFAIKGYGARNHLKVHLVGEVVAVDAAKAEIQINPWDIRLFSGIAPKVGAGGNWFLALTKITGAGAIEAIFGEVVASQSENPPITEDKLPYHVEDAEAELFMAKGAIEDILRQLRGRMNIVLQGPPGVGKSFAAWRFAFLLLGEQDRSRIEFVQFHPNTTYDDFVYGLRPDGNGSFAPKPGVFYRFCERARLDEERDYVFIIDELNRSNVAKVFGELLMLLEADKRGIAHEIPLATGGDDLRFSVPDNVFVICTMNTADKSLALVDYALRRRFAFITLTPNFGLGFERQLVEAFKRPVEYVEKIRARCTKLNELIGSEIRSLGPGYLIGHSFFCGTRNDEDAERWYKNVVHFELRPLLEEYWADDPKKAADEIAKLLA